MTDLKSFWDTLVNEVGNLAKLQLPEFKKAAEQDGQDFLDGSKVQLEKWAKQLADGEINKDDFEFLVKGLKDLAEMEALKQAGLAVIQIDRFKKAVINTVIETAFKMFS